MEMKNLFKKQLAYCNDIQLRSLSEIDTNNFEKEITYRNVISKRTKLKQYYNLKKSFQ